eukprot:1008751_1
MAFENLFLIEISSTIYYDTIPEAITTFIIMTAAAFVSLLTLVHTIYKFFCEQLNLNELKGDQSPSIDVQPDTIRGRSNSATRSHIPSRGGSFQHKPHHSKEISFLIAALTLFYLLSASLYTFGNWLIRLLTIFFSVDIGCAALAYIQIGYVLIKISFYVLFIARLHLTFDGTNLAVKPLLLKLICAGSITLLCLAFVWFLVDVERQFKAAGYNCSSNADLNYFRPLLPAVIVDTTTSIILLYLFINKLSQLIRIQTSSITAFDCYDKTALERIKNLVLVMTKLTILVCVYIIVGWCVLFLFLPILPGASAMVDVIIGTICVILCYEFHQGLYDKYCFLCKIVCFHTCFWWFIICKEESRAMRRLHWKNICCPEKLKHTKSARKVQDVPLETKQEVKQEKVQETGVDTEDTIAAMMMNEVSIKRRGSPRKKQKMNVDDSTKESEKDVPVQSAMESADIVYSAETDEQKTEDELADITHEKTSTFIINLNAETEDKIFKNAHNGQDRIEEGDEVDEDEEDMQITKSETNTFDHRADRLLEMHRLFFDPTFGEKYKKRKRKKEEKRNRKLMGKKFETDYKVHEEEDEKKKKIDHVVKKSKTAAY